MKNVSPRIVSVNMRTRVGPAPGPSPRPSVNAAQRSTRKCKRLNEVVQ